jgi:hypothetical protein
LNVLLYWIYAVPATELWQFNYSIMPCLINCCINCCSLSGFYNFNEHTMQHLVENAKYSSQSCSIVQITHIRTG